MDGIEDVIVGLDDDGRKALQNANTDATDQQRKTFGASVPKERQDMKAVNDGIKFGTGC